MLKEIEHRTLGPVKFLDTPLRFLNSDASVDAPPPAFIGEHTDEILGTLLKLDGEGIGGALKKKGPSPEAKGASSRGEQVPVGDR